MQPFDPLTIPLSSRLLIEASAGTGKTYSIALLYARLILDRGLDVDEILVVTFTTSATEELRGRIRDRLGEMLEAMTAAGGSNGLDGRPVPDGHPTAPADSGEARRRLEDALQRMDQAAVYTIHGFCQRMLQDYAFESETPFGVEFMDSERQLRCQIIEDFWRRRFYTAAPEEAAWVLANWQGPDELGAVVQGFLSRTGAEYVPAVSAGEEAAARKKAEALFARIRECWRIWAEEVTEILRHDPCLSRSREAYGAEPLEAMLAGMSELAKAQRMPWILPSRVEGLSAGVMTEKLKGRKIPPAHPLFSLFEEFYRCHEEFRRMARVRIIVEADRWLRVELDRRKRLRGQMYFDDLLTRFAKALDGERGSGLRRRVRARFRIAMVDEFQDTDPLQYRIFHTLFGRKTEPGLVMIGDPKQSIYSFRGADIFAYLRARRDTPPTARFTMDTNYRSTSAMVHLVNRIFDRKGSFVFAGIDFHRVRSWKKADERPLRIDGAVPLPLRVYLLQVAEHGARNRCSISGERAGCTTARWTAQEIARLIRLGRRGSARIGPDPLAGGDIAVLVRTHREAYLVQQELRRLRIACVYYSQESVYATDEAAQMYRVLAALLDVSDESMICDALVTDLFGFTGDALHAARGDRRTWAAIIAELGAYHARWHDAGVTAMFQELLIRRGAVGRILTMGGGERKLTNYLHLLELLQDASARYRTDDMVRWFNEQMHHPVPEASTQQLRLESDENLVRIITIHRAKGMEYPVVFLPFLWSTRQIQHDRIFSFHDPQTFRLRVDVGSGRDEHYRLAEQERLAEDLRLLYVALTRASHCCYLAWGRISGMEKTALALLLHGAGDETATAAPALTEDRIVRDICLLNGEGELVGFVSPPAGGGDVETSPVRPPAPEPLIFGGRIDGSWSVTSYSRLISSISGPAPVASGLPGRPEAEMSVFTFPRGPEAGNCLHGLLEIIDFAAVPGEEATGLIPDRLRTAGIDGRWAPLVGTWLEHILSTRLLERSDLRLQQLSPQDRLAETGFYFPLPRLQASAFNAALAEYGIEPVDVAAGLLNGLMTGYIDLVFRAGGQYYIADYKSNHLGSDYHAYRREFLEEAMRAHRYDLQYLIYTVALHRYLGRRLPAYDYAEHFGGVFYLFLRGMHPDLGPDCGVWHDRPERGLVERLDRCFGREEEPDA